MAIEFSVLFLLLTILTVCCKQVPTANAISCFVCSSRNFEDKACHDPINTINSTYDQHCKMSKAGHMGTFPAHYCVKITGVNVRTQEELVVRMCTLTSMDNQCGIFRFDNETLKGCIMTCNKDGCNRSNSNYNLSLFIFSISFILSLFLIVKNVDLFN